MKRKQCYVLCGLGIALLLTGCGNTSQTMNQGTEMIAMESQSQEMEESEAQSEEMGEELTVTEEPETEIATEVTKEEDATANSSTGTNGNTGTNSNTTPNGDTTQNNSVTSSEPTQETPAETAQQTPSESQEAPYYPSEEEIYKEEYPPIQGDDYQPTPPPAPVENKYVFNEDGTINFQESEIYKNSVKDELEFLGYLYNSNELKEFLGDQYYHITRYSYSWGMGADYPNISVCINEEYWLVMHFNSDWKLEQGGVGIAVVEHHGLPVLWSW